MLNFSVLQIGFKVFDLENMERARTIRAMLGKIKTSQKWSIGKGTPNRTKLAVGDKVLFYQGGENGRKIVASAELASGL